MASLSKSTPAIAAGVAASLFVCYCIYFDRKRRSDPNYKKKVHERRMRNKRAAFSAKKQPLRSHFLQDIQIGEMLISKGDYETGVDHLAKAIAVSGQNPQRMLDVLQIRLPEHVRLMVIAKVRELRGARMTGENICPIFQDQTTELD